MVFRGNILDNPRHTQTECLHEDSAHACTESHDPESHASKGSYEGTLHRVFDEEGVAAMHYIGGHGNPVHTFPV